jgi:predicted acyltransferase
LLGVLFNGGVTEPWPEVRLLGVLQRIALCYFFSALLFLHFGWRGLTIVIVGVLIGYWALLTYVPVPGLGVATYQNDVNLANWIDRNFLPGEKFDGLTDPEGLLSTFPAVATCLLGVLAGLLLQTESVPPRRKACLFMIAGVATAAAGYLWGLQFPIIKAIWTSSFVLVTGGYSFFLLGLFYLVIDVEGWQAWATVFKWVGVNALALYFLNGVAGFEPFAQRISGGAVAEFLDQMIAPNAGTFITHVLGLCVAISLAAYLYRRRIFIRV